MRQQIQGQSRNRKFMKRGLGNLVPGLLGLGLLGACAGPEGMFMGGGDAGPAAEGPLPAEEVLPAPDPAPVTQAPAPDPTPAHRSPQGIEIDLAPQVYLEGSVEGRPLHYWVLGDGPQTVLLLAGKHGNERSSCELAYRFLGWAVAHPEAIEGCRLIVAPLVNPDGYARNSRENAHLVDLNRNFPAENWQPRSGIGGWAHRPGPHPQSEPEARFLLDLLQRFPADRVISLHGAASCVNWDGPAEELAREIAANCGLPPKDSLGYPTPGSFGSYVGLDLCIPTITLELTQNREIGKPFEIYCQALLTGLFHPQAPPLGLAK